MHAVTLRRKRKVENHFHGKYPKGRPLFERKKHYSMGLATQTLGITFLRSHPGLELRHQLKAGWCVSKSSFLFLMGTPASPKLPQGRETTVRCLAMESEARTSERAEDSAGQRPARQRPGWENEEHLFAITLTLGGWFSSSALWRRSVRQAP